MKMQWKTTGRGEPLVLVPGGVTGWLSWETHAEQLANTRTAALVQLLSVQLGLEDRPLPPDYSIKTESAALAASVDEMGDEMGLDLPVDFAGWSMGALITLDFALDNPDAVRSLVLIEPPAFWVLDEADIEADPLVRGASKFGDNITEDHMEEFARLAGFAPPGVPVRDLPQWPVWARHRRSLRNAPAVNNHRDSVERLSGLNAPVLLVKGTGSTPVFHRIIDVLAAKLPNAEVAEWPGGHAPHIVSMEPFLEKMARFQERVPAQA